MAVYRPRTTAPVSRPSVPGNSRSASRSGGQSTEQRLKAESIPVRKDPRPHSARGALTRGGDSRESSSSNLTDAERGVGSCTEGGSRNQAVPSHSFRVAPGSAGVPKVRSCTPPAAHACTPLLANQGRPDVHAPEDASALEDKVVSTPRKAEDEVERLRRELQAAHGRNAAIRTQLVKAQEVLQSTLQRVQVVGEKLVRAQERANKAESRLRSITMDPGRFNFDTQADSLLTARLTQAEVDKDEAYQQLAQVTEDRDEAWSKVARLQASVRQHSAEGLQPADFDKEDAIQQAAHLMKERNQLRCEVARLQTALWQQDVHPAEIHDAYPSDSLSRSKFPANPQTMSSPSHARNLDYVRQLVERKRAPGEDTCLDNMQFQYERRQGLLAKLAEKVLHIRERAALRLYLNVWLAWARHQKILMGALEERRELIEQQQQLHAELIARFDAMMGHAASHARRWLQQRFLRQVFVSWRQWFELSISRQQRRAAEVEQASLAARLRIANEGAARAWRVAEWFDAREKHHALALCWAQWYTRTQTSLGQFALDEAHRNHQKELAQATHMFEGTISVLRDVGAEEMKSRLETVLLCRCLGTWQRCISEEFAARMAVQQQLALKKSKEAAAFFARLDTAYIAADLGARAASRLCLLRAFANWTQLVQWTLENQELQFQLTSAKREFQDGMAAFCASSEHRTTALRSRAAEQAAACSRLALTLRIFCAFREGVLLRRADTAAEQCHQRQEEELAELVRAQSSERGYLRKQFAHRYVSLTRKLPLQRALAEWWFLWKSTQQDARIILLEAAHEEELSHIKGDHRETRSDLLWRLSHHLLTKHNWALQRLCLAAWASAASAHLQRVALELQAEKTQQAKGRALHVADRCLVLRNEIAAGIGHVVSVSCFFTAWRCGATAIMQQRSHSEFACFLRDTHKAERRIQIASFALQREEISTLAFRNLSTSVREASLASCFSIWWENVLWKRIHTMENSHERDLTMIFQEHDAKVNAIEHSLHKARERAACAGVVAGEQHSIELVLLCSFNSWRLLVRVPLKQHRDVLASVVPRMRAHASDVAWAVSEAVRKSLEQGVLIFQLWRMATFQDRILKTLGAVKRHASERQRETIRDERHRALQQVGGVSRMLQHSNCVLFGGILLTGWRGLTQHRKREEERARVQEFQLAEELARSCDSTALKHELRPFTRSAFEGLRQQPTHEMEGPPYSNTADISHSRLIQRLNFASGRQFIGIIFATWRAATTKSIETQVTERPDDSAVVCLLRSFAKWRELTGARRAFVRQALTGDRGVELQQLRQSRIGGEASLASQVSEKGLPAPWGRSAPSDIETTILQTSQVLPAAFPRPGWPNLLLLDSLQPARAPATAEHYPSGARNQPPFISACTSLLPGETRTQLPSKLPNDYSSNAAAIRGVSDVLNRLARTRAAVEQVGNNVIAEEMR